jgi:hypothetical protein
MWNHQLQYYNQGLAKYTHTYKYMQCVCYALSRHVQIKLSCDIQYTHTHKVTSYDSQANSKSPK